MAFVEAQLAGQLALLVGIVVLVGVADRAYPRQKIIGAIVGFVEGDRQAETMEIRLTVALRFPGAAQGGLDQRLVEVTGVDPLLAMVAVAPPERDEARIRLIGEPERIAQFDARGRLSIGLGLT